MGDISYLTRAKKFGIDYGITGVGCSGNYLTTNSQGKPITLSSGLAAAFEKEVEQAEANAARQKALQVQAASQPQL